MIWHCVVPVEFILENYSVLGIIVSGTIIRGNQDLSSDLDIYVIQKEPFRQRLQKFFNHIPAEIFVNPPKLLKVILKMNKQIEDH